MPAETLHASDHGLASAAPGEAGHVERWSVEQIAGLDWRRIAEIVRAMASFSGFTLGPTTLEADARADFTMQQQMDGNLLQFLVRLAPWNSWVAAGEAVEAFARDLAALKHTHGIYIAPMGFSQAAVRAAHRAEIELVDGALLVARLNQLPEEHSAFYHLKGTAGDAATPSCPVCLNRLVLKEGNSDGPPDYTKLEDVSYRASEVVGREMVARRLEVMGGCEVHFLQGVRAQDIIINGVAVGNLVCDGIVLLNPGAKLFGDVAARSVLVRPGAEMHGETRILQSNPEPMESTVREKVWRCDSPTTKDACRSVELLPH